MSVLVINLAHMTKESSMAGSRSNLEGMARTLEEALQSDSSDSEESDEEEDESMSKDTEGAASTSAATAKAHRQKQDAIRKSFLKKPNQEKRPTKARKKRGKRRN